MANHKSAIKRHKQSLVRKERNKAVKTSLRTVTKRVEASATGADKDAAASQLKLAIKAFDKAASKGVVHKRTAARTKSRLSKKINAMVV
ncbi:MAG: 30S ribosomal protein S20 [bacterium]|nr:30S ribosomal protein S20 [bacterium]